MRLPHPRVRVIADAGIASMALTRRKVRALNDASFVKERRVLSASAGIPTEQLEWIAMYKLVPLAATQNLEVDERKGLLRILLRKDAAAVLSRQRSPVVTLAVGRDKNTGSIVQALIP